MTDGSGQQPGDPPAGQQPPAQPRPGHTPPGQPPPGGPGGWSHPPGGYPPAGGYPPPGGYGPPGPYGYGAPQPPRPGIIPLRPLRLGEILDGTVKMIRANPKATLGLSAVVGAVSGLPVAITQAISFRDLGTGGLLAQPARPEELSASTMAGQSASTFVSVVFAFVATTILTGLLTRVLGRAVFGAGITIGEAWRMTRSRVWALLGLSLLVSLVVMGPGAVVVAVAFALGAAAEGLGIVVAFFGLTAFAVYAVFFGSRLALAPVALVLERLRVTEAMRRSWNLVKNDTMRVFGIILVTQLLIAVVSGVAAVPFSMGAGLLSVLGSGTVAVATVTAVLLAVGNTIGAMLTYPISAGVYGLLYADRRMRAEAFDLELQTAANRPDEVSIDDLWQPTAPSGPPQW